MYFHGNDSCRIFLAIISPNGKETYIIHNIEKKNNLRYHAVIHFPKIFQKPLSRHAICCRFIFPPWDFEKNCIYTATNKHAGVQL